MDINIFQENGVKLMAAAGAAIGGSALILRHAFTRVAGIERMRINTQAIMAEARKYVTLRNMSPDSPFLEHPEFLDPAATMKEWGSAGGQNGNIESIIFSDARSLNIFLLNGGDRPYLGVPLSEANARFNFERAKTHLLSPARFKEAVETLSPVETIPKHIVREARQAKQWAAPSYLRKAFGRLLGDYDQQVEKLNQALLFNVKVLAMDPSPDIALFGTCHVALKWTGGNQKANIVVMVLNSREADSIRDLLNGKMGEKMDPKNILSILSGCSKQHCSPPIPAVA